MDISWADLETDERRAIAVLGAGLSIELCDPLALLTLRRLGLIVGFHLTTAGHNLRTDTIVKSVAG